MAVHIFAGPTLPEQTVAAITPGAVVHGPIAHGDLLRLSPHAGDIIVLIDGYFHQAAPVRHKEILATLAAGAEVIGCSSMGALRAAELHAFGMTGNGRIFEMYRDGLIEADDEVAVMHGERPAYQKLTESTVNIRIALSAAEQAQMLTTQESQGILELAKGLPYTQRTWRTIELLASKKQRLLAEPLAHVRQFLLNHPEHADAKAADAIDTLRRLGQISGQGPAASPLLHSGEWANSYLYEWMVDFAGSSVDGVHVSAGANINYQQLYTDDFPHLWRRFALRQIARAGEVQSADNADDDALTELALRHAQWMGIQPEAIPPQTQSYWLTPHEQLTLGPREAAIRILVRSFLPPRHGFDLLCAEPSLAARPDTQRAVAESYVINREVATWHHNQSTDHIKDSAIRAHLAEAWKPHDTTFACLEANARDRGFNSLSSAIKASRIFFLRHHMLKTGALPSLEASPANV